MTLSVAGSLFAIAGSRASFFVSGDLAREERLSFCFDLGEGFAEFHEGFNVFGAAPFPFFGELKRTGSGVGAEGAFSSVESTGGVGVGIYGFEVASELEGVNYGEHGRDADSDGDSGLDEAAGSFDTAGDAGGFGFKSFADFFAVGGDAEVDADILEALEEVDVAGDEGGAGLDDYARLDGEVGHVLKERAGEAELHFDGLVGVGGGAEIDFCSGDAGVLAEEGEGVFFGFDPTAPFGEFGGVGLEEGGVAVGTPELASDVGVEREVVGVQASGGFGEDGFGDDFVDFEPWLLGDGPLRWFGHDVEGELHIFILL